MFASLRKCPLAAASVSIDVGSDDLSLSARGSENVAASSTSGCALARGIIALRFDLDEDAPPGASSSNASSASECTVDGHCPHAPNRAASKYYLFTVVAERGDSRYKKPDEIGREGLFNALKAVYAETSPEDDHALHKGPLYGIVAQDLHSGSNLESNRNANLHGAAAFAAGHSWKTIDPLLRENHQIKMHRMGICIYIYIYQLDDVIRTSCSLEQYLTSCRIYGRSPLQFCSARQTKLPKGFPAVCITHSRQAVV